MREKIKTKKGGADGLVPADYLYHAKNAVDFPRYVGKKTLLLFVLVYGSLALLCACLPFVGLTVAGPLACAWSLLWLNVYRGKEVSFGTLFSGFSDYLRNFLLHLVNYLFVFLWGLLLIVPGIFKWLSYRMSYYIMADDPNISFQEARKRSMAMMEGREWDLFRLEIRFLGWWALCLLTLGVFCLWVVPYREAAYCAYYENLRSAARAEERVAALHERVDSLAAKAQDPLPAEGEILKVTGVKKYFPIQKNFFGVPTKFLRAVDNVSFAVKAGTTIGVVGESGCGKTTLGRTILRLYETDGGTVYFEGDEISHLKQRELLKYRTDIQLIFQDPYSSLPPRMTVGAIIAEAVRVHHIVPKEEVHDYVLGVMEQCGLQPQYYDRYPHEFSGGQRQRICIARALAVKPKLVICDEPVSALDVSIQAQIINLLKDLQNNMGLTYVFISHDLSVVKYITDQIMVMYLGNVMELGSTGKIFGNPLHPYTKALFSAVPVPNPDVKMQRIILEGDIPSPANPPKGCKFHTRCAQCMGICKFLEPIYVEAGEGHFVACHLYNREAMEKRAELEAEYERIQSERLTELEHARRPGADADGTDGGDEA